MSLHNILIKSYVPHANTSSRTRSKSNPARSTYKANPAALAQIAQCQAKLTENATLGAKDLVSLQELPESSTSQKIASIAGSSFSSPATTTKKLTVTFPSPLIPQKFEACLKPLEESKNSSEDPAGASVEIRSAPSGPRQVVDTETEEVGISPSLPPASSPPSSSKTGFFGKISGWFGKAYQSTKNFFKSGVVLFRNLLVFLKITK